jgi:hypothetical protein
MIAIALGGVPLPEAGEFYAVLRHPRSLKNFGVGDPRWARTLFGFILMFLSPRLLFGEALQLLQG